MKSSALIFVVALLSFSWIIGYVLAIEQLDTSIPVPGGDGVNQFLFDLGNSQMVELDVINPAIDFSFRLIFNGVSGNHSEAEALKDTPIALFTFIVENEATVPGIDFGAAIRLIYNDALFSVDPSTLSWYEFRSDRWREFPDPSTLSALTKTVTQGFQRDALRPGETYLGVYGGNSVKFPDDDYDFDLYDRYDVVHPISKTVSNKFSFALPGKNEAFELEVLGADRDYSIILSRPTENPFPSASFPSGTDTPVYFFTLAIQNNARPTYNIVFRYKYKTLPVSVDPTTLQFAYYKGSSFSKFALEGSKNELSGIVTQGASSIDDSMPVTTNLVIVGRKSSAVPSPSPSTTSPTPSSKPPTAGSSPKQSTDPRESSKKNHSDNIHFNLVLMVLAMSLFALAHHIF